MLLILAEIMRGVFKRGYANFPSNVPFLSIDLGYPAFLFIVAVEYRIA
jgi:hypothetical protein